MFEATLPDELNTFYARFDLLNKESAVKSTLPPDDWPLSVSTVDVRRTVMTVIMSKAARPDNIPGHVLTLCLDRKRSEAFCTCMSHRTDTFSF